MKKLTLKKMKYKVKKVKCCNNCYFAKQWVQCGCTEFGCNIADGVILNPQRLGICDYWLDRKYNISKHTCTGSGTFFKYHPNDQIFYCYSSHCRFCVTLKEVLKN